MRKCAVSIMFVAIFIALAGCNNCKLSECSCDGFNYSCRTTDRIINYEYDLMGRIIKRTITYDNGHVVWCTYRYNSLGQCSGGECHDNDNVARCEWGR